MVEWSLNPLVAIGIALAVMFFGYFFGLAEGNSKGYKKRRKEEAEEKKHSPAIEPLPPASPPVPSNELPVLDVSMTPDGELRLKMDGQRMNTSTLDAEQRKRLIAILTQIRPWLEAPRPVQSPQGEASSLKGASSPKIGIAPAPAADERPTAPPPPEDDDEPVSAPNSIVAQIDSVLQARLAGSPLKEKGIRLQESLDGGVLVWVGIDKYEGVDEVPDEEIKAALRAAIKEWEDKYTPGL